MKKYVLITGIIILIASLGLLIAGVRFTFIEISPEEIANRVASFDLSSSSVMVESFNGGSVNPIPENPDTPQGKNCWDSGCSYRTTCNLDRCVVRVAGTYDRTGKYYDRAWVYDKGDEVLISYSFVTIPDLRGTWTIYKDDYNLKQELIDDCPEGFTEWSSCIDGEKSRYVTRYDTTVNECIVEKEVQACIIPPVPNTTDPCIERGIDRCIPPPGTPPVVPSQPSDYTVPAVGSGIGILLIILGALL